MSLPKLWRFAELLSKPHPMVWHMPRATYARASFGGQQKDPRQILNAEDVIESDIEELGDIAEYMSAVPKKFRDKGEKERKRRIVTFKVIQRKYFKETQEVNLLTWDAKEQIRFLHAEYPDEWTIPTLAQSFPISEVGIIRLLKSKYFPRTLDKIIKHDQNVRKNWLALKAGEGSGGPIAQQYEALASSGKMHLLKNASGIQTLPAPERNFLPLSQEAILKRPVKSGPYSSLIKDYYEKKEKEREKPNSDNKQMALELKEKNKTAISDMIAGLLPEESGSTKYERIKSFKYADSNISDYKNELNLSERENTLKRSMFEDFIRYEGKSDELNAVDANSSPTQPEKSQVSEQMITGRRLRRRGKDGVGKSSSQPISVAGDLGMTGTLKIPSREKYSTETQSNKSPVPEDVRDILENSMFKGKFVPSPETEAFRKEVQYEVVPGGEEELPTAYIYDEHSGYQYPHGAPSDIPQVRIKLPDKITPRTDKVYKKGKDCYDDDGEFLYRVP